MHRLNYSILLHICLDKMAASTTHMTLKRTNENSYIHPGKQRHNTTLVKHI